MNKNVVSLIAVGLAFGVVAMVCLIGLVRRDQEEPLGGEIQWDDFGFSALSVRSANEVGPPDARIHARNEFRILRMKVTNHAQRVDYDLDNHKALLEDASGAHFALDERATRALLQESGASHPKAIHPRESDVRELAFDVPKDIKGLRCRIVWGGSLLQMIDETISGDRVILLPD
jgi:hypothetical protein